jgi:hypothetical protein
MAKAKRRRARKRKAVSRAERVEATPQTLAKLMPCNLAHWLRMGPENGGITAKQNDDLKVIVEAWESMIAALDFGQATIGEVSGRGNGEMSDSAARLWSIWLVWAKELQRRYLVRGYLIAEMVRDNRHISAGFVDLLRRAADLWDKCAGDHDGAARAQRHTIRTEGDACLCH